MERWTPADMYSMLLSPAVLSRSKAAPFLSHGPLIQQPVSCCRLPPHISPTWSKLANTTALKGRDLVLSGTSRAMRSPAPQNQNQQCSSGWGASQSRWRVKARPWRKKQKHPPELSGILQKGLEGLMKGLWIYLTEESPRPASHQQITHPRT